MVEHGERVAHVGVPRVQLGVVAVAVAPMVPADDPPSAGGELGCEHVEGAGEVHAAVDEQQRRRVLVAPFVDRDPDAVRVELVLAGGVFGARVVELERRVAHHAARVRGRRVRAVRIGWLVASALMNRRGAATDDRDRVMLVAVGVAGCGTTDEASRETLPPIRTTIAITTTTSTTVPPGQRFYTIKPGETLGAIAAAFEVTVQSIVDLNGLANPDAIQAGQTHRDPERHHRRRRTPDHDRPAAPPDPATATRTPSHATSAMVHGCDIVPWSGWATVPRLVA